MKSLAFCFATSASAGGVFLCLARANIALGNLAGAGHVAFGRGGHGRAGFGALVAARHGAWVKRRSMKAIGVA